MSKGRHVRSKNTGLFAALQFTKPEAATGVVWDRMARYYQHRYPIRYWLVEELPLIVSVLRRRLIEGPHLWLLVRTVDKTHVIRPRTLKPGWHSTGDQILHSAFEVLVNHVEDDMAYRNHDELSEWRKKRFLKHTPKFIRQWIAPRSLPQLGLNYLDWRINSDDHDHSADDRAFARTVLELYMWWTCHRPARPDPYEDTRIWGEVDPNERVKEKQPWWRRRRRFRPTFTYKTSKAQGQAIAATEFYKFEDQMMLQRLIRISSDL